MLDNRMGGWVIKGRISVDPADMLRFFAAMVRKSVRDKRRGKISDAVRAREDFCYRVLNVIIGNDDMTDVEAVKIVRDRQDATVSVSVNEFRKWLPTVMADFGWRARRVQK
jgi:hypothetical protein